MGHTLAQQLFTDLFYEAADILQVPHNAISIVFAPFQCSRFPADKKSLTYCFPVHLNYSTGEVNVQSDWVEEVLADKLPTIMRTHAYYYAFALHQWIEKREITPPLPQGIDALSFAQGLSLLNGVPVPIFVPGKKIADIMHDVTKKNFILSKGISVTGGPCTILQLSDSETISDFNHRNDCTNKAYSRRLNFNRGTEHNPFENIDEAIRYIKQIENDEVVSDPFLNSSPITDKYRYDIMAAETSNGEKIVKGWYKIPWASQYTAHVENNFPEHSFVVTQLNRTNNDWEWLTGMPMNRLDKPLFCLKPNLSRRRFLFRGQTQEYRNEKTGLPTCVPNIYREDSIENPLPHRIKAYEMACVVARHPLVEQLGIKGVEIFNEPFIFQLNRQGLAQHYYNRTSLMDLTSDIEVAKFFATCKYNSDDDIYEPYYGDGELGILYVYDMRLPGEFNHDTLPQLSTIGKQYVFLRSEMQSGFLLNMPKGMNLHNLPNVYRIYFKHDRKISEGVCNSADNGRKYFPTDALSQYWKYLKELPERELCISVKAREMYMDMHPSEYQSISELDTALVDAGFILGDNTWPVLPMEIVDDYYANSQKLWNDFCENIYFLGSEGYFMKQSLVELNDNPKYRDAFVKPDK